MHKCGQHVPAFVKPSTTFDINSSLPHIHMTTTFHYLARKNSSPTCRPSQGALCPVTLRKASYYQLGTTVHFRLKYTFLSGTTRLCAVLELFGGCSTYTQVRLTQTRPAWLREISSTHKRFIAPSMACNNTAQATLHCP